MTGTSLPVVLAPTGRWRGWRTTIARLRVDARTVRVRTTAAAVLVVGVTLTLGSVTLIWFVHDTLTRTAHGQALIRAREVAADLNAGLAPASSIVAVDEDSFVQVLDADGQVVIASRNIAGLPPLHRPPGGRTVELDNPVDDGEVVVAAAPARGPSGQETVLAAASLESADGEANQLALLLAVGVPLVLVVVAATTWRVVGRALAPVDAIRTEVDEISAHELHRRVEQPEGDDEITRLAATMNRMLGRLDDAQRRQRRFVSDAAHELRSPIASIRQHAEVALAHPDGASVTDLAGTVLAEDVRIQRLVEDLLLLARADETDARLDARPVDLDDLVLAEVRRLRARGGPAVDSSAVSAGRVSGVPGLLASLVGNLVENAARHARSRVAISLREQQEESTVELVVDDDGPGIPDAQRFRVFERFVRLDDARSRDAGGSGLGLAIAADVVRAHGGLIEATQAPLGGARLLVRLPLADD
jgi:signal transduction histidine kinase